MRSLAAAVIMAASSIAVTLEGAVDTALQHRGDVAAARAGLRGAEWEERSADLWFLPSVTGTVAFQRSHDVQTVEIPGMGSLPMGSEYGSQAGLG
ncbi:MAG: hypothetical protein ACQETZ_11480, partial [Candidatus Fermentibacterota bacterium]